MNTGFSLADRLRYRFDNYMARGTTALIGGLGMISLIAILAAAAVLSLGQVAQEGAESPGFVEAAWESLMRALDSGAVGGDTGWSFRLVMFCVTFFGIFVLSTLIGVLNTGIEAKLDELRKGRSRVIERGHTVILGWSDQVFPVVAELVVANANQKDSCIVVMGEKDKIEMEDELRAQVGATGRTRVVCRTGNPIDLADLDIVSLNATRSVIVLAPEGDDPDSAVIKTMLAITNNPKRRPEPYHIVAELSDPRNLEVARMVGKDEAELVLIGGLIARIIAQTCRQSGLSVVYTELLDFGGDEIYFKEEPGLIGKTFGEALLAYGDSAVIGLASPGAAPRLNPPMHTRLQPGDQLIAISADDDTIRLSGRADLGIKLSAIQQRRPAPAAPERTLILGWNWRAPAIVNELDHYVAPGSAVTIVADLAGSEAEIAQRCAGVHNQQVAFEPGDTTDRGTLEALRIETYDHVIVLSYAGTLDPQRADARTLITLLHLRELAERAGQPFSIVSEMLDGRNRALAEVTKADDFIVSDKLVSLMLSQVAENKRLNAVLADIFDPEGSEIYLKPALDYVALGEPLNFYTVTEAARQRGEVAIGYKLRAHASDPARAYGVIVNPDKAETLTFAEGDRIIVLAEG